MAVGLPELFTLLFIFIAFVRWVTRKNPKPKTMDLPSTHEAERSKAIDQTIPPVAESKKTNLRYCPQCQATIKGWTLFCPVCGKPTVQNTPLSYPIQKDEGVSGTLFRQRSTGTKSRASEYILDPSDYRFDIVGESNYQAALASIAGAPKSFGAQHFCTAVIDRELSNPYDKYACVVTINTKKVGYVSRSDNQALIEALSEAGFPKTVPALIVGGWENESSSGNYGVKLNISLPGFETSQAPATDEQRRMFKYVEGKSLKNLTADQFKEHLRGWKKALPDKYIQWESLTEVLDQLSDKEVRDEYGIKAVSKKEAAQAFHELVASGVDPEEISCDLDIVVDLLVEKNPMLKR